MVLLAAKAGQVLVEGLALLAALAAAAILGVNVQVSGGSAPPGYTGARPTPKGESGLCRQSTASDRQHHLRTLLGIASPWGEANRRRAQSLARLPTARTRHPLLGWDGAPLPGFASGRAWASRHKPPVAPVRRPTSRPLV